MIAKKLQDNIRSLERIVGDLSTKVEEQDDEIMKTVGKITQEYLQKYSIQE